MKLNFSTSWCIGFSYNLWTLDEQISIFRNLIQRTIECLILSPSRSNEDPCSSEIEFNFPDKPCLRWLVGLNHQHTLVIVSQYWLSSQSLEGQDYMLIITLISQSQSLLWCFWTLKISEWKATPNMWESEYLQNLNWILQKNRLYPWKHHVFSGAGLYIHF